MVSFTLKDLAKLLDVSPTMLVGVAAEQLLKWGASIVSDEQDRRDEFEEKLHKMSDEQLRATYVPDVYQKSIYKIDYGTLKDNGIKLISFDIDDTIGDVLAHNIKAGIHDIGLHGMNITGYKEGKEASELFKKLHEMGFTVTLLSNAHVNIVKPVCKEIGADGYICRAEKPDTKNFERMLHDYGNLDKTQMAHVGNNIRQDVAGGNAAGVTTCLVRNRGFAMKVGKLVLRAPGIGLRSKGHLVREELKKRGIWRKHHKFEDNDQYYQLKEKPRYQR